MTRQCKIEGCEKPVRSTNGDVCMMHYHRFYRYGTYERVRLPKPTHMHSSGYIVAHVPGHPLVEGRKPYEYQHRVVFYDAHGPGPFKCHWCANEVTFEGMHVDHYDKDRTNNAVENLLPSCPYCNISRPHRARYFRLIDLHIAFKSLARDPQRGDFRIRRNQGKGAWDQTDYRDSAA